MPAEISAKHAAGRLVRAAVGAVLAGIGLIRTNLYDRRIVAYVVAERNDNPLVFKTFDCAVKANPDAHPLYHSDRGFQYTNRAFHHKLKKAGMTQSMSRVAKCIDNGPMEGFWGILKRERYYGKRFTCKTIFEYSRRNGG